ncbi:MAG: CheR family methyltransferase [Pseudomonadota bacterium]
MSAENRLNELLNGLQQMRARHVPVAPAMPVARVARPPSEDSSAALARLAVMLRDYVGFRTTEHLQRKLQQALRHMDAQALDQLLATLAADSSRRELLAIVEDLTNHETYFFRDPMQLDVLSLHILPALIRQKARTDRTLRIWSAACSTGEEAWSLAMLALQALLDAGHAREPRPGHIEPAPGWTLDVLGTDIARPALRIARDGAYSDDPLASFRQFPAPFLRFFEEQRGKGPRYRRVRDSLRRHVSFENFNLVGNTPPRLQCDLVLCRNVLIYLDPGVQPDVQRTLRDALRPGGHLMLGVVDRLWRREDFHEHWYGRTVIHERK